MKTEMRRELARQPFEQKIRRVAELVELARSLKAQRPTIAERAARVDWGKVDSILARVPDVAPQAGEER